MSDSTENTDSIENKTITDPCGEPIEYDGNSAHAEGCLASIGEFLTDHGEFVLPTEMALDLSRVMTRLTARTQPSTRREKLHAKQ